MTEPEKNTTDPKPGETQGGGEMWLSPRARIVILILNSLGFAFFLAWLISLREQPIMREQEGILYFLPALPFLFVYLMMMPRKKTPPPEEKKDAQDGRTRRTIEEGREGNLTQAQRRGEGEARGARSEKVKSARRNWRRQDS